MTIERLFSIVYYTEKADCQRQRRGWMGDDNGWVSVGSKGWGRGYFEEDARKLLQELKTIYPDYEMEMIGTGWAVERK